MSSQALRSVLFAGGPSETCGPAFFHALRLAVSLGAELTLLRAEESSRTAAELAPDALVRDTLERWRSGSVSRELEVSRVVATGGTPLEAAVRYLERHPADLMVLHSGYSLQGVLGSGSSVQGPMGRRRTTQTLFVGDPGFVDPKTGALVLRNILIPVAPAPEPEAAVEAVEALLGKLEQRPESVTLLWVGDRGRMPRVTPRTEDEWCWRRVAHSGRTAEEILRAALAVHADLIAMAAPETEGPLSVLTRSESRHVVREAPCPVLAVPAPDGVTPILETEAARGGS